MTGGTMEPNKVHEMIWKKEREREEWWNFNLKGKDYP